MDNLESTYTLWDYLGMKYLIETILFLNYDLEIKLSRAYIPPIYTLIAKKGPLYSHTCYADDLKEGLQQIIKNLKAYERL